MASDPPSAVDRILALADQCVLCGLCLPHCPTYRLDRLEGESPRGRIMLMKGLAEGRIGPEPAALAHLDHCLACRSCERVCPAHVAYGELLMTSRAHLRAARPVPATQRMLEQVLPRARLRDTAFALLRRLRPLLPARWRRLPAMARAPRLDPLYPAAGSARGEVALFTGCLGRHQDAVAARGAIELLNRLGWNVRVPPRQGCCGALHRHAGNAREADALVAVNRSAFAAVPASAILTLASGCHEAVSLGFDGASPVPRVADAFDFIVGDSGFDALRFRASREHGPVALHLPCTQRNVLRSAARVAPALRRIPGMTLSMLPDTGCCGAAGSYMQLHPERADALRAPLLDAVQDGAAATLCSANVGCRMHLQAGLRQRGLPVAVRHPLELLAEHLE